jgi:hypothetical protein
LKRVLAHAAELGFRASCGLEFEWFNFQETPDSWAAKGHMAPAPLTPGMFGYSLLRAGRHQPFFEALMEELAAFRVPLEGCTPRRGPACSRPHPLLGRAGSRGPRRPLQELGEGDRPPLRHHAELHGQVELHPARL